MLNAYYFYDEEGKYTHMDMAPLEFDSEGVQILPENSTYIFPPDLATEPKFSVELNEWIPQVAKEPYSSEDYKADVEAIRQEFTSKVADMEKAFKELTEKGVDLSDIESTLAMQRKSITRLDEDLFRTKYHLQICLPNAAHYFK